MPGPGCRRPQAALPTTIPPVTANESNPAPLSSARKSARWVEMLLIFFGLPAFVALLTDPQERARPAFEALRVGTLYSIGQQSIRFLFPVLIVVALLAMSVLLKDPTFENRQLWNRRAMKRDLPRMLAIFVPLALLMLVGAWLLATYTQAMSFVGRDGVMGSAFLRLPREAPVVLVLIAIGYPWASCYPQEVTHRAYFFHRYAPLMPLPWLIALNTLAFAWLHAPFWSLEALALTAPGGLLFAWTYHRTRSTLGVTIEHALYGWWAFFTGLGWFVFTGSIGR